MPAIPLLDLGFLQTETDQAHMHFGGLLLFEKPADLPDVVERLHTHWLTCDRVQPPFNYVPVRDERSAYLLPRWSELDQVPLAEHVHRLELPPGSDRAALLRAVEPLHSARLDRGRPLWQVWLIDGVPGQTFAVYVKVHHAIFDGHGGLRFFARMLAEDPATAPLTPFWAARGAVPQSGQPQALLDQVLGLAGSWRDQATGLARNALEAQRHLLRWLQDPSHVAPPAFSEPECLLNGRLSGQRRLAHVHLPLADLARAGAAAGASVNDVLLCITGGAVRRYLKQRGALPRRSLTALVPVSLRPHDDPPHAGNRLTFVPVTLATDIASEHDRLNVIRASAADAKARLRGLGEVAATQYGLLVNGLVALTQTAGLRLYGATPANLVVTNLSGPDQPRYLGGARLQQVYAHAPMANGVGLNVALVSYAGSACLGLTADPDLVDDLDELARWFEVAVGALAHDH
ncbi:MAG: wax ester/triacylglycerol synthase family O-acyltransferase [Pseudomonadales bacterium]